MRFFKKDDEERDEAPLAEIRRMISEASMPADISTIAFQELDMLSKISPSSAEYTVGLTYIDYLASMPWNRKTQDNLDMRRAEHILNEEHYGLLRTKERILEHLAVKTLRTKKKPRVMVVDDEEVARKNLSHILEKEGYEVAAAATAEEALPVLKMAEFDVVLADLMMPGIDGLELLEKIKGVYPHTRVIMITGYATVRSATESMKKGAFTYIAKPFKLEEVRDAVKQAVDSRNLFRTSKGSVLCFVGPPGTGKTSLGRSIAKALGRRFVRISLAGIKDEAEIRGHRRTYAGAMPGRIIDEIHRIGYSNPVMILDELDKIGRDFKGDPSSALLEVLDPEQNAAFVDHYLDVPFDLSNVMFILTANVFENIPSPLADRMEIIEFAGYTEEEKARIASAFLIPRQIAEKGLSDNAPLFAEDAVLMIIREYTHEAGIRNLERVIASVCRKVARKLVRGEGGRDTLEVTPEAVGRYLGPGRYRREVAGGQDTVGVTTGLVQTAAGGEIIFVEAVKMKGRNELIITGSLGDIMRESARAALSYIRSNAGAFGIPEDFFESLDIHIHVPAGAIRKDGPSAGITIAAALVSLLTGVPARRDVAMSGEITLTGKTLPVSGVREKILAAKRAMMKTVLLPSENRCDVEELPADIRRSIDIILVDSIIEAVRSVLTTPLTSLDQQS